MNKKIRLKRIIIIFSLCICLIGCKSEEKVYDEANIETLNTIKTELVSTDEVLRSVNKIIKWQTDGADEDLEKIKIKSKDE